MAYMRGKTYIWQDEHRLHIWTHDGYDGWDISGWAVDAGETRHPDKQCASGTAIPQETMDEYVVMRLAELYRDRKRQVKRYKTISIGFLIDNVSKPKLWPRWRATMELIRFLLKLKRRGFSPLAVVTLAGMVAVIIVMH